MTDVVHIQSVHKVLRREHVRVVADFQREGLLVKMVNTGHVVSPVGRPQSRILRSLSIFLKLESLALGAPDWCRIAAIDFPNAL